MQRTNQCSIPKQKLLCQYICPVSLWWFIWRYAREDNLQCWLRLEIKQRYLFCFLLKVWNRDTSKARVTEKSYRVLREARTGDCLTRGQFWTLWSRNYGTKQDSTPRWWRPKGNCYLLHRDLICIPFFNHFRFFMSYIYMTRINCLQFSFQINFTFLLSLCIYIVCTIDIYIYMFDLF